MIFHRVFYQRTNQEISSQLFVSTKTVYRTYQTFINIGDVKLCVLGRPNDNYVLRLLLDMQPGVMHLRTQTIKLYSNLLSFSEPLKKAHRILSCGTAENKERFETKTYFLHKFKMLGKNGCLCLSLTLLQTRLKGQQLNFLYQLARGNSKRTQETGFAQCSWSF